MVTFWLKIKEPYELNRCVYTPDYSQGAAESFSQINQLHEVDCLCLMVRSGLSIQEVA
ncbi:hypothetical protein VB620_13170 [Nodularia harveyana UHCC-0300]|uniref:Uncharacterized protein n=1 Tax=Nodularia harveyana UHCC-0300 TaxID=2974287 RepID=A0ABU5UG40_9CYAN|nr:hypothetical protein [Nodularia harveyana]MEA5582288.1 hypothetical protein [Nodularia harveyana UHCC-0300]